MIELKKCDGIQDIRKERNLLIIMADEPGGIIQRSIRIADRHGTKIRNIEIRPPSLEAAFINIAKAGVHAR
jgi:hypothetical protein